MIYFTHIFPFPARGSAANGLSEVLFKTLTVQGGSDISALRATGRTGLNLRRNTHTLLTLRGPIHFILCYRHFFFNLKGKSSKSNESVANSVSVLSGIECSCAECDVPGRRARRFYFWWVSSLNFAFSHTHTQQHTFEQNCRIWSDTPLQILAVRMPRMK